MHRLAAAAPILKPKSGQYLVAFCSNFSHSNTQVLRLLLLWRVFFLVFFFFVIFHCFLGAHMCFGSLKCHATLRRQLLLTYNLYMILCPFSVSFRGRSYKQLGLAQ